MRYSIPSGAVTMRRRSVPPPSISPAMMASCVDGPRLEDRDGRRRRLAGRPEPQNASPRPLADDRIRPRVQPTESGTSRPDGTVIMVNVAARLRNSVRWLFSPPAQRVPRGWLHCPICDRELVGPYPAGTIFPVGTAEPNILDPNRDELVAKCPVHGHLPYNDATKRPPVRRIPLKE
jgi:hypothetical protein